MTPQPGPASFCPTCGRVRDAGSSFCANCGTRFDAPAASRAPTQPAYSPQPYPAPFQQSTNGLAIASLVLGILWLYWIGSILALIFGYVAKGQIASANGRQTGGGVATAGIVLGWIGVGILGLVIVIAIAAAPQY
jgi:small-conductance mechanosensitive channel